MPIRLRELTNLDVDPLNQSKNKYLMRYNATNNNFDLIPADVMLAKSAEDGDISDEFVDQLEQEIDVSQISNINLNGGTFWLIVFLLNNSIINRR